LKAKRRKSWVREVAVERCGRNRDTKSEEEVKGRDLELDSGLDQLICPAQAFHQNPHDFEGKVGRLLNQKLKTLLVDRHQFAISARHGRGA